MNSEKCALLVVDMQLVAFDGKITPSVARGEALLQTIAQLLCVCRSGGIPIIFLQTCAPSGRPYARDMHGWEIHPKVAPLPNENIVFKVGPSGFENPELEESLKQLDKSELIICGIWSEGCVSITTRGALKRGYGAWLVADGHTTVREDDADAATVVAEQNLMLSQRGAKLIKFDQMSDQLAQF